jgi:hypothetical protein
MPFTRCERVLYHRCSHPNRSDLWPDVRSKCSAASVKGGSEKEVVESVSQECRPELGRYLLQVDKQTKGFFPTPEAAHSEGLKIKKELSNSSSCDL